MGRGLDKFLGRSAIVRSLFQFLWKRRMWWMIPLISLLIALGILLVVAQQSVLAPFIYAIF